MKFIRQSTLGEDQLSDLHSSQVDNWHHRRHRLDIHLLLKISLRLPCSAIDHSHTLVPGNPHGMNVSAVQYGRRPGYDIMILMLRSDGNSTAVDRKSVV